MKTPKVIPTTLVEDEISKAPLTSTSKLGNISKASQNLMKFKITDSAKEDNQQNAKPKPEVSRSTSLILLGVPVCNDSLLEQRALFEQKRWSDLSGKLGLNTSSTKLCRLCRGVHVLRGKPPY
ncbi:unnamed protein product [Trichobilharzia regenti]|nr:unnamed protein product [Trichobilharzia regenti]